MASISGVSSTPSPQAYVALGRVASTSGAVTSASTTGTAPTTATATGTGGSGAGSGGTTGKAATAAQGTSVTTTTPSGGSTLTGKPLSQLQERVVRQLQTIDRSVRAHEAAHQAAGGGYTGPATFTYTRGPDGKQYATAGEVPIDSSSVPNNPQATIAKLKVVIAAALAPSDPSAQDRSVAADAQGRINAAEQDLNKRQAGKTGGPSGANGTASGTQGGAQKNTGPAATSAPTTSAQGAAAYRRTQAATSGEISATASTSLRSGPPTGAAALYTRRGTALSIQV